MSLRARLLLAVVGLLAAAVIAVDVAAVTALRAYLTDEIDQELITARKPISDRVGVVPHTMEHPDGGAIRRPAVEGSVRVDGGEEAPGGAVVGVLALSNFYVEVRRSDGTIYTREQSSLRSVDAPAPAISDAVVRAKTGGGPFTVESVDDSSVKYRAIVSTGANGSTFIIATSLDTVDETVARLLHVELVVTVAALVVLIGIGWLMIRADLRPLEHIADTASAIAAGDLSKRVDRADDRTEVGKLGLALNTMLEQIETSFDDRERSARRLRQFAADASHELRTPLTAVRGYAEMYRQGVITDEDQLRRAMGRIESEASRMGRVVEDLLLLARLDQDRGVESAPVDLGLLAADVVSDARAIDPARSIECAVSGKNVVLGDKERLHQVAANLVGNALTHTPEATPIRVSVTRSGADVVLAVRDEGPGLDPEIAEKVFERFYRADRGRSRESGGAGLGLAIVQSLVEAHGGSVRVDSVPGEGATFVVTLPSVDASTT